MTCTYPSRLLARFVGCLILLNGLLVHSQTLTPSHEASLPTIAPNAAFQPFCISQEEVATHPGRDGLLTTLTTEVKECQDGKGRRRHEQAFVYRQHPNTVRTDVVETLGWSVTVTDPRAGRAMSWVTLPADQRSVYVYVYHFKPRSPQASAELMSQIRQTWGENDSDESHRPLRTLEPLGVKTVQGLIAQGTRETHFHPAGREGNNIAYSDTIEDWVSVDYRLTLERKVENPNDWDRTLKLKSFVLGEPDASLFTAPEGYTIIDPQKDVP